MVFSSQPIIVPHFKRWCNYRNCKCVGLDRFVIFFSSLLFTTWFKHNEILFIRNSVRYCVYGAVFAFKNRPQNVLTHQQNWILYGQSERWRCLAIAKNILWNRLCVSFICFSHLCARMQTKCLKPPNTCTCRHYELYRKYFALGIFQQMVVCLVLNI